MENSQAIYESKFFVPRRFEMAVATHVFKNVANLDTSVPLILGIHGRTGEGKTKQCEVTLRRMKVEWVVISGGELEHRLAGRPGELIRDRYREASEKFDLREGRICVLLINDFDTGIGIWSERTKRTIFQYTINLQNVYATLMNLVDHPTSVDGIRCNRVPIIITGNDFGVLYKPLVRDGRMTKFRWKPTIEEKIEIVRVIFNDMYFSADTIEDFVKRHANQPVAFFAHVKSALVDDAICDMVQQVGLNNVVQHALSSQSRSWLRKQYSARDLDSAADRVVRENITHDNEATKENL